MTEDAEPGQLLELYKLHTELADRVSQRREGANRLYAGLLTGFAAAVGALLSFESNGPENSTLLLGGVVGAALAASWFFVIRSYRQLNSGKFTALRELEDKLEHSFFKREWELLGEGREFRRYWKLTVVEVGLPAIFFVLSIVLVLASVFKIA